MIQPFDYTCPIMGIMIYAHDQPIEYFKQDKVKNKFFEDFEYADEKDKVIEISNNKHIKILKTEDVMMPNQEGENQNLKYQAIEFRYDFENGNEILHPICWIKICSNKISSIKHKLSRYISSRFTTVQFISVDNRSREVLGYYSPNLNIDVSSVQLIGHSIPSHLFNY